MKNNRIYYIGLFSLGFMLLGIGAVTSVDRLGFGSEILINAGALIIGLGTMLINKKDKEELNPELLTQRMIENQDERHVLISYKAKAKAADTLYYVILGCITLGIILSQSIMMTLMLLAVCGLYLILNSYYKKKYEKEM